MTKVELLKAVTNRGLEYWQESYVEEFYNSYKLLEAIKVQFGAEAITKLFDLVNSQTYEAMQILRYLEQNNANYDNEDNEYTELYVYLEQLYRKSELRASYSLDNFMNEWIYCNIANESKYETEFSEQYFGTHYRSFEIDHETKAIKIYILEEEE